MSAIAKVEPLVTARSLRGPFDYRLPREMSGVEVGTVLVVPFGRRRMLGVVVDVAGESDLPPERLVEPVSALEQGVPAELVGLGLWLAEEYCSTPARGLALVLPPGTGTSRQAAPAARTRETLVAEITGAGREALEPESGLRLTERQRRVLETLSLGEPARLDSSGGEKLRTRPSSAGGLEELRMGRPAAELARLTGVDHASLRRLAARGLIELSSRPLRREVDAVELGEGSSPSHAVASSRRPELTLPQRDALRRITAALHERRPGARDSADPADRASIPGAFWRARSRIALTAWSGGAIRRVAPSA
jgi:primosomal protein N' (replication factor Y)